jgi:hypothetical protein
MLMEMLNRIKTYHDERAKWLLDSLVVDLDKLTEAAVGKKIYNVYK